MVPADGAAVILAKMRATANEIPHKRGGDLAKKRKPPVKPVVMYETPDAMLPPGAVDGMAAELEEYEASGSGPHEFQAGSEEWPGWKDIGLLG